MAEVKPKAAKVEKTAPEKFKVRSKVGLLVHPYTPYRFEAEPVEVFEIDSWLQCQIDAGKAELC